MPYLPIYYIRPGSYLGRTIYDENGTALFWKGCVLSRASLQALAQKGIETLYVHESADAPTCGRKLLPADLLAEAGQSLNELFQFIAGEGEYSDWVPMAAGLHTLARKMLDHFTLYPIRVSGLTRSGTINPSMAEHSLNVGMVAGLLAKTLELSGPQVQQVITAGLLHDIGKIFVSPEILYKPGNLSPEELEEITKHPDLGFRILMERYAVSREIGLGSLQHHERWDGRGYPRGLRRREIDLYARIIAVADVFDAMTSKRVYRQSLPATRVLAYIRQQAGRCFDPEVVSAMERLSHVPARKHRAATLSAAATGASHRKRRGLPALATSARLSPHQVSWSEISGAGDGLSNGKNNIN